MEKTFLPIVQPEKFQKFQAEWQNWLVLSNEIEEEKFPGKLKPEFTTRNGQIIALCPKNYFAFCYETNEVKDGRKGIPKWAELTMNDFYDTLYNDQKERNIVEVRSLRLNRDKHMSRTTTRKAGLSAIHVKLQVDQDRITCSPLRYRDGTYL